MEKYGDALVCVRYRYDDETRTRLKTVELIVEKKELPSAGKNANKEKLVAVRISYGERDDPLHGTIPNLKWYVIDRCGHSPWKEKYGKEEFYRIVDREVKQAAGH